MPTPEDLAVKVCTKANELLQPMQTEMDRRRWPPDLRKVMWQAVADTAAALAAECAPDDTRKIFDNLSP